LTAAEVTDEMLLMGLRLTEGVDLDRLVGQGGVRPDPAAIASLAELGLIEPVPGPVGAWRLCATDKGRFVLNEIVLRLSISLAHAEGAYSPMDFRPAAD
jgi:oxygen-independent coproporphyrinogen-3 oxidase